jgi:hypothetical protein
MVDSREATMAARIGDLIERVEPVETKVDTLAASVADAFVEQRRYRELAYDELEVVTRLTRLDSTVERMEQKLDLLIERL